MRFKVTIILILANLLVFFLIYRLENEKSSLSDDPGVFGPEIMDIDRIEIGGRTLREKRVLERVDGSWKIVSPIEWTANYYAVNRILTQLQFLEREVSFSVNEIKKSGQTLEDYGLQDPNLTLSFTHMGKTSTLKIGEPTQIGNRLYALSLDGNQVLVIRKELIESISVDMGDLRSQNIFNIPLFEVRSLALQVDDLKIRLAYEGKKWLFEAPIKAAADSQAVKVALNQLISTQVHDFIGERETDPELQGLRNPSMRITLQGNNRRQTLLLGNRTKAEEKTGLVYARLEDNPTVFTVTSAPFDFLSKAQENLREKNFFQFDRNALNAIEITGANNTVSLQKLETGIWQVLAKSSSGEQLRADPADERIMESVIEAFLDLRVVHFVSDAPAESDLERFGFNDPQRTIILKFPEERILLIGNQNSENDLLYAKIGSAETATYIYEIEDNILDFIPIQALHYRKRILASQPSGAKVEALKLTDLDKGELLVDQSIDPETENWEAQLKGVKNKEAILLLIETALGFEVKTYLQERFKDAFEMPSGKTEPWAYRLDVTLYLPGGKKDRKKTLTFFFTQRMGGTLQGGGSPEFDMMFTLKQPLIDTLFTLREAQDGYEREINGE